jgi:prepilin-type N-terminal cleavage/methylation domain-containing protein
MMIDTNRDGFTLLETIITMSLLAIVAAMGAPRLSEALRSRTTDAAADQFVTAHSLARATALRYGRVAQLHINPGTRRFWVEVDTSGNGRGQRATVWYVRDLTERGLVMTSNRTLLCFDARGLATPIGACEDGNVTVTFTLANHADTVRSAALGKILR